MRRSLWFITAGAMAAFASLTAAEPGAAVGPTAPQQGLVLHYPMESLVQGVLIDHSTSSLDGRLIAGTGTAALTPSLKGYGMALQLSGQDRQYVDVPEAPALNVDKYTLSAWINYTGVQNDQTLGRWEVLEKAGAYWINVRTNGLVRAGGFYGGCSNPSWEYFDSTRVLPIGRWKHVAATYNGTWLRVYIDGRAAGAKRISGRTCVSSEPLAVGAKNNPSKGLLEAFWDGRIDDVRIYNRALTATEVGQLATRT